MFAGAILTEVPKRIFPKKADAEKLAGRIPPVIISTQELRELKIVKEPGGLKQVASARSENNSNLGSTDVQH